MVRMNMSVVDVFRRCNRRPVRLAGAETKGSTSATGAKANDYCMCRGTRCYRRVTFVDTSSRLMNFQCSLRISFINCILIVGELTRRTSLLFIVPYSKHDYTLVQIEM
ncbi:unnamed protein product [Chrysodeixis includens]|uniref:Uncharacterized protein n=1 Tax=Chrysodeixis includens TaxID=689277 RepID=A0A9P0BMK8_CHRIL|nr:unnamed protein product [Chrysodeixis includens]